MILFNNKEILVGGKPIFISEWLSNNILFLQDLRNSNGQFLSYQELKNKFACRTNFLQFYQVVSAIPKHLVTKVKNIAPQEHELFIENSPLFQLDHLIAIHFGKAKTRDIPCLLNKTIHTRCQTGPTKWNQAMHLDGEAWKEIFNLLKNTYKEAELKEFQFKLIHKIVVTKNELFRYGIKTDDECLYCGEHDSIDHTFNDYQFVKHFEEYRMVPSNLKVLAKFGLCSNCSQKLDECLFGRARKIFAGARMLGFSLKFPAV